MKTFVIVDAQEDFTRGALFNDKAIEALDVIHDMVKYAEEHGHNLIYTQDTHGDEYLNTFEGKRLPVPHCIKGTLGHEICKEVWPGVKSFMDNRVQIVEKNTFGGWKLITSAGRTELYDMLSQADEIILCGFCTDICVSANFQLLRMEFNGIPITVVSDACAGVTPELHEAALKVMKSCQADVKTWKEWKNEA